MKNQSFSSERVRQLTLAAMLTAIVFVLELLGSLFRLGIFSSASLVLIPIVVGAALLGWQFGAWLGFVFAAAVLISGDAAPFLAVTVFGTFVTVILKGTLAGAAAGLTYSNLGSINPTLGVFAAAVVCPVVNTGVFLLGCRVFFWQTLSDWAEAAKAPSVAAYAVFTLAGVNFLLELALSIALAPAAVRLIRYRKKNG